MRRLVVALKDARHGKAPCGGQRGDLPNPAGRADRRTQHFSLLHNEMAPGYTGNEHAHDVEPCFYALGGRGVFTIGGMRYDVGAETAVSVPAGAKQDLRARGYQALSQKERDKS